MDVVNLKISKLGGLTKTKQARDLCVSHGHRHDAGRQLGRRHHDGRHRPPGPQHARRISLHQHRLQQLRHREHGRRRAAAASNGFMAASSAPGLGITPRMDVLGPRVVEVRDGKPSRESTRGLTSHRLTESTRSTNGDRSMGKAHRTQYLSGCIPALMTPCRTIVRPISTRSSYSAGDSLTAGMRGVVYCGSMGDWPLLTDEQRQEGRAATGRGRSAGRRGHGRLRIRRPPPAHAAHAKEVGAAG